MYDPRNNLAIQVSAQLIEHFGEKVYQIRENVIENLNNLKKNGQKIIGYGAPAKTTTALNYFGISKEIDYIIEDNPLKVGKFVPGVNIQIRDKKKQKTKLDSVIVLAWNFFDEIKKNNQDLSDNFINIKKLEKKNY